MNRNKKYVIAQGIIWAGAILASAVTSAASGTQNQFIMIPILACGAAISIVIQVNSMKNANGSNVTDSSN